MHSITCSFMWSGVSPLNHLLQRDWKSLELFVGRREMEHHNSVLVSWRITFLYMLKSKQNPRFLARKLFNERKRKESLLSRGSVIQIKIFV